MLGRRIASEERTTVARAHEGIFHKIQKGKSSLYHSVDMVSKVPPDKFLLNSDVNDDGTVDMKDLVLMACAYGSTPICASWNVNTDLDQNGCVGLTDLADLATHYGQP